MASKLSLTVDTKESQANDVILGSELGMGLTENWIEYYCRQLVSKKFGLAGQMRLADASVLVIGAGGLGSVVCPYLSGLGIGTLGIVDGDIVEYKNLHRQLIHSTHELNMNKAISAQRACRSRNPNIKVEAYAVAFSPENANELTKNYDLIVDCTDNPGTRYTINSICLINKKPWVSGSALSSSGQLLIFSPYPTGNACYRCLYPEPPSLTMRQAGKSDSSGILSISAGLIGQLQCALVLQYFIFPEALEYNKMMFIDLCNPLSSLRTIPLPPRDPNCKACGNGGSHDFASQKDYLNSISDTALLKSPLANLVCSYGIGPSAWVQAIEGYSYFIFDVRPVELFDISHIKGSTSYPLDEILSVMNSNALADNHNIETDDSCKILFVSTRESDLYEIFQNKERLEISISLKIRNISTKNYYVLNTFYLTGGLNQIATYYL